MSKDTHLLIIGAGPFGLAMAAYAQRHNIDYLVVGSVGASAKIIGPALQT